jgi:hypothetical protein
MAEPRLALAAARGFSTSKLLRRERDGSASHPVRLQPLDPFRGSFLHRFCVQVAADRRNVGVHPRADVAVQSRFTIFGAKDNMNDHLAKRLRHCGIIAGKHAQVNRVVSASEFFLQRS